MKIQGLMPIYTNKLHPNTHQVRVNIAQKADVVSFTGAKKSERTYEEKLKTIRCAVDDYEKKADEGKKHFIEGIKYGNYANRKAQEKIAFADKLKEEALKNKDKGKDEGVATFNIKDGFTVKKFISKKGLPTNCFFAGDKLCLVQQESVFCIHSYGFVEDESGYRLKTYERYKNPESQIVEENCEEVEERFVFDEKGQLTESAAGYKYYGDESVKSGEVGFYKDGKIVLYVTDYAADKNGLSYGKASDVSGKNPVKYSIAYKEYDRETSAAKNPAPKGKENCTEEIVAYDSKGKPVCHIKGYKEKGGKATCESYLSLDNYGISGNSSKYAEQGTGSMDKGFTFKKEFLFNSARPIKMFVEK